MEKEAPQGELALCCRPAAAEDFPFLFSVLKENMQELYQEAFGSWEDVEEQAFLRQDLAEAPYHLLCRGEAPIGFFSVEEQSDAWFVRELQLLRGEQGRGVGTCFLLALHAHAAAAGKNLRLEVLKGNQAAARLYEKLGFRETGQNATHKTMEKKVRR